MKSNLWTSGDRGSRSQVPGHRMSAIGLSQAWILLVTRVGRQATSHSLRVGGLPDLAEEL